jgi:enoyl-CoA hydratase
MSWDLEPRGGAVVVRMRSNSVNRMNPAMFEDMHRAFDTLDREHPRAPVVLVGEGSTFSAGLDFNHVFPLFRSGDPAAIATFFEQFRGMIVRVARAARPTVAALNGHAFAGGLILACACDLRVAARGPAKLALNEVPIGIAIPSSYLEIVRHAVGTRVASEAALFARVYDVDAALAAGLVHTAVDAGALLDEAVKLAASISDDTFDAFVATKTAVNAPLLELLDGACRQRDLEAMRAIVLPSSNRAQVAAFEKLKKR